MSKSLIEITSNKNQIQFTCQDYSAIYTAYKNKKITFDHQFKYEQHLICAKACFANSKYPESLEILKNIPLNISTKILYERQALSLKAIYLRKQKNVRQLISKTYTDFDEYKEKCPGSKITKQHIQNMKELVYMAQVGLKERQGEGDKQLKQQVTKFIENCREDNQKIEGMPCFLYSKAWDEKLKKFTKDGVYPGPILNFQLINHIFEHHKRSDSCYPCSNHLIFPSRRNLDYFTMPKQKWQYLFKIFDGIPVSRINIIANNKSNSIIDGDNTTKILVKYKEKSYLYQWPQSVYWQKSVYPYLTNELGIGQFKHEKGESIGTLILTGRIFDPFIIMKYTKTKHSRIKATTPEQQNRKSNIILKYDLQSHKIIESLSLGKKGLINLGNTCYLNSAIQCLSQIKDLSAYFVRSKYLSKLNISSSNVNGSYGEITCAYAELIKQLWFGSPFTFEINPTRFKQVFGRRYKDFSNNDQQDAQQFLMFLLNCLHDDLNEKQQKSSTSNKLKSNVDLNQVRDYTLQRYYSLNQSIISQKFTGFNLQSITCKTCKTQTYRFDDFMMFHIQFPPEIEMFVVHYVPEGIPVRDIQKIQFYLNQLKSYEQLINTLKQQLKLPQDSKLYGYLVGKNYKLKRLLKANEDITKLHYSMRHNKNQPLSIFIYETKPVEDAEQFCLLTFDFEAYPQNLQSDGFPRLLPLKRELLEQANLDELESFINYKVLRIFKSKIIEKVIINKIENKVFQTVVKVRTATKTKRFNAVEYGNILGKKAQDKKITLHSCLARMQENETISEDQGWICGRCKQNSGAIKATKIFKAGDILLMDFKRFTQTSKIQTKIFYETSNFDITPYIFEPNDQKYVYDLVGVVKHKGSMNIGHYTALCYNQFDFKWYCFDDEIVTEVSKEKIVTQKAYILVYQRK